jgi:hypothetical protein
MVTHSRGEKYILSASISREVGGVLDERNKEFGIIKSFEVEQALRRYYGIMADENNNDNKKGKLQGAEDVVGTTTHQAAVPHTITNSG